MKSIREDIRLLRPDIDRDAPFALDWFNRAEGRQTLLSMGNAEHEIKAPTIEGERLTIQEFIELEKTSQQITRMIVVDRKTIGAVWIELIESHGVNSPSLHIIIGNPEYRGKGIGASVMQSAVNYIAKELEVSVVYSRYLATNGAMRTVNNKLGFKDDGAVYKDVNGLVWQNVKLVLS